MERDDEGPDALHPGLVSGADPHAAGRSLENSKSAQRTTTASTSRADSTRNSSAPNFTSVPPYLL